MPKNFNMGSKIHEFQVAVSHELNLIGNIAIILISCVLYLVMLSVVSPKLSHRMSRVYRTLTEGQKLDWNARINSTINGILTTAMATLCQVYDGPALYASAVWNRSKFTEAAASLLTGYLCADLIAIAWYWKYLKDVLMVIHHLAAITVGSWCPLISRTFHYFGTVRLFAEMSSPFINIRWFLDVLGYSRSSLLYIANGLALTIIFFCARVAVIPHLWKTWWIQPTTQWSKLSWMDLASFYVCSGIFDILNIFWMHKILRGCAKVIVSCRSKIPEKSQKTE